MPAIGGHSNGIATVTQNNLRKRVAASTYSDNPGLVNNATYYTYDIDGNVNTMWQQVNGLYTPSTNAGLKRIDYEYDLISGKVNFVRYQDGQNDRFYYRYSYDADNRLINAWSGVRALVDTTIQSVLQPGFAKLDAKYYYYLHGPLARMELGDTLGRVQGVDYAYTLQGWLKGTNSSAATDNKDMGADSLRVAKDAYGYSLYYYGTGTDTLDYASISSVNPFSTQPAGLSYFKSLYNGNIAGMSTNITRLTDPWHYYTYKYDQLNRLRQTYTYKVSTSAVATRVLDYSERFTYDGNGNIDSAARYMGANTKMDSTLYHYNTTGSRLINNRLNYITDNITTHNWPYGLDNQPVNNYTYDAIGNMTADQIDSVSNVLWNVYGKIQSLNNPKGTLTYTYDAAGQRVTKNLNGITTYYIRDAQGNTLALYDNTHNVVNWKEQDLYGSSRLGMWQPNISLSTGNGIVSWDTTGKKQYELKNHLENVWLTISDKRVQHTSNSTSVDYFNADISTAQEYYAFGGLMPGRTYTALKNYRYGFNGKENDNDAQGVGRQQDYGMRIYDPLTGRFFSVDPIEKKYPELSSYQFASNTPILAIDLDGLEAHQMANDANVKLMMGGIKLINKFVNWWNTSSTTAGTINYAYQQQLGINLPPQKATNGSVVTWAFAQLGHYMASGNGYGTVIMDEPVYTAQPSSSEPEAVEPIIDQQATSINNGNQEAANANSASQKKLQVGTYDLMKKSNTSSGLSADHIPSFAALKRAAEEANGAALTLGQLKQLRDESLTLVYETDLHQQYSRTYGGRNAKLTTADATNLLNAVKKDIEALTPALLKAGYSESDINNSYKELSDKYKPKN